MLILPVAIFWSCVGLVGYTYLIYPLVLPVLARLFGKPVNCGPTSGLRVAFLVPVYNEEEVIERKLRNILSLEYPPELLEIYVGSDCSTDTTHALVNGFGNPRVHLWIAPTRGGKTQVINRLAPTVNADILVMTDANTMHRPGSLANLLRPFADSRVGGVAGHIDHLVGDTQELEERVYRSFESRQKTLESRLHSTISAFGGFYAVRSELFRPIPSNAYSNDDVMIPMNVIRQNKRMIFEPRAAAYEDMSESVAVEFKRRIRIGAGNFQAFFWLLDFLSPLRGWPAFCFFSHKVGRWFSPVALALGYLSCALLALTGNNPWYRGGFIVGTLLAGAALVSSRVKFGPGRALWYFLVMNAGLGLGLLRYLRGIRTAAWERTDRNVSGS